jgi:predicted CopG family antitoxin
MRTVKSFTINDEILSEIASTKGTDSTSERVNELLKRALDLERRERLELEAAEFFAKDSSESLRESDAYQAASKKALSRG